MCCRHSLAGSKQGKSRDCSRSGSKQQRRQERHFFSTNLSQVPSTRSPPARGGPGHCGRPAAAAAAAAPAPAPCRAPCCSPASRSWRRSSPSSTTGASACSPGSTTSRRHAETPRQSHPTLLTKIWNLL